MHRNVTKRPVLTAAVAVLAASLVLSVPTVTSASATPGAGGSRESARHAHAKKLLDQVVAAFAPSSGARTAPRTTPLPRRDLSLAMQELQREKGALSPREQSIVDNTMNRPVPDSAGCADYNPLLGTHWKAQAVGHFCVHYQQSGAGAATPEQAIHTANTMNYVYNREVVGLGFRDPRLDSDNLYDVFLDQIGDKGYYGFCTTDTSAAQSTSWCGLDNDFAADEFGAPPENSLRVTAAHEFFHAIQFGYDGNEAPWFMEGTSVWMEDIVYPTINDYLQYIAASQVVRPRQSTDYAHGPEWYGAVTFWKFLSERFRDNGIIRQVWTRADYPTGRNGLQAVKAVLAARGYSFNSEFARYAAWNMLPPGTYGDRALFPSPGAWAVGTLTKGSRDTGVQSVRINHLASAPVILRPGSTVPTRAKLRIIIDAPNSAYGSRATVQVRFRNGSVKMYAIPLNSSGNGSKVLGFNRTYVRSAIAIMTNASAGYNNQLFKFRARLVF